MCTIPIDTIKFTGDFISVMKKRKKYKKKRTQRDVLTITRRKLLRPVKKRTHYDFYSKEIPHDSRRFKPFQYNQPLTLSGTPAKTFSPFVREKKRISNRHTDYNRSSFYDPRRVSICVRRTQRREYLFKTGKIGKGKRVSSIRRFNDNSRIRC